MEDEIQVIPYEEVENPKIAIRIQNAEKSFKGKTVISNLNMTVPEGTIYGLLGASGCGKTTILNCILGLNRLDCGSIEIFGYLTGSRESGIPGSRVGLMPQELSLFKEFTIKEILFFFGRIYGMNSNKIEERIKFLVKLLKLPENTQNFIKTLSGGQQRRVSFAVSLIHEAQILILDEPTVGVDPTLRKCIWEYLCEIVATKKTTIIITTHYIEEAENASIVGVLRNGRMLVEESPQKLMIDYGKGLSDIVLEISQNDEKDDWQNLGNSLEISRVGCSFTRVPWNDKNSRKISRVYALLMRNFIKMWRNFAFISLLFLLPAVSLIGFALAFNGKFDEIHFGIVNYEKSGNCSDLIITGYNHTTLCKDETLSCRFLSCFPEGKFKFRFFTNEEIAINELNGGKIEGYLMIPQNFTKIIKFQLNSPSLFAYADNANKILYGEIRKAIDNTFEHFKESWPGICPKLMRQRFEILGRTDPNSTITTAPTSITTISNKIPNMFEELYGEDNESILNTALPGMHLDVLLFMGMGITSLTLILEKKSGIYERCLVAGVSTDEIILSHFINQFGVSCIQGFASLLTLVWVFQIPVLGSYFEIIILSLMMGSVSNWIGFLISAICPNESIVLQITVAIISPLLYSSGIIWPVEGMPIFMRYLSNLTPLNMPVEAIKSITLRGWGIMHQNVYPGFLVLLAYNIILPLTLYTINKLKH